MNDEQEKDTSEGSIGQSASTAGFGGFVIPSGWQLVPQEPTDSMVKASWDCIGVTSPIDGQRKRIAIAYHAMLKAAPKPSNVL